MGAIQMILHCCTWQIEISLGEASVLVETLYIMIVVLDP